MSVHFGVLVKHREGPATASADAKVVFSDLQPGACLIPCAAPSVKLVLEGEETYSVDGVRVRVGPGQFLFLDAGAECIGTNRHRTVGLCLALPRQPEPHQGDLHGWDPVLGRAIVLPTAASAFGRTLETYGRTIANDWRLGEALAPEIVHLTATSLAQPIGESRAAINALTAAKPATKRELFQRLERARAFIHENAQKAVTMTQVSCAANLSQFHLSRYFKMAFGDPPLAYHRQLRLRCAEPMLRQGLSLHQVASALGYSDEVAFSHAFKKLYHMSPNKWGRSRD